MSKNTSNLYYDNGDSITKSAELSDNEKAIADKAAKLIARDYGEVIRKLEEE